jgi:hypothetical protein
MGWGFPIFYSTKNKVFTAEEQNIIDKICRNLNKFTKKKFTIDFSIEVNEDYGIYKNIKDCFNIPGAFKGDLFMIFMCTIAASIPFIIKFLFF